MVVFGVCSGGRSMVGALVGLGGRGFVEGGVGVSLVLLELGMVWIGFGMF